MKETSLLTLRRLIKKEREEMSHKKNPVVVKLHKQLIDQYIAEYKARGGKLDLGGDADV